MGSDSDACAIDPVAIKAGAAPRAPDRIGIDASWMLIPIVAASGFAGLGYEIVWTRQLSLALGTEMMAVLGAVAGFFGGLAIGAFALDRTIARARSPQLVYAGLEAIIGLWGVVCIWLLPAAGRGLAPLLGTEPAPALMWAASFALPMLVLLPATVAMGGTLAALERIVREARRDVRVSAGVYGANTAGAVAGALASTFIMLPTLGLSATLACLAAVNLACAVAIIGIRPRHGEATAPVEPRDQQTVTTRLAITLLITGLLGIAFEVLVVRLASQVMQDTIYTFAGLLAAYLLGTAAGGLAWQRLGPKVGDMSLGVLLGITALACLGTAALAPYVTRIADTALEAGVAGELAVAAALFVLPSAAMGALFGHLAQQVRDQRGSLGWAVGINSIGACVAPLLSALVLIPTLGTWTAIVAVSASYLLLMPWRRSAFLCAAVPAAAAACLLLGLPPVLTRVPQGGSLLAVREGPMATASVVDDASGARYLEVNGRFRMGGTSSARSDYRQAMLALLLHPSPHDALFLGIGTGATIVGGARMPGVSVHGIELSQEVVDLLPYFASDAAPARPRLTVADARRYVVADREQHDVIIADLFHPALDGSGALYTTEHFAAVRQRLAPGGIFCQWLPLYQLDLPSLRTIIRGFLDVYPGGSAWLNHYSVGTPMLALIGPRDSGPLDLDALKARLETASLSAIARPLGFETPIDLLGQYLGGPHALAAFAGEGPRNTDDFPFVTFDAERNVRALTAPPWSLLLQVTHGMHADASELLPQTQRDVMAPRLDAYWQARNRFLEAGAALTGNPRGLALIEAASPGLLATLRLSAEFEPAYQPLLGMAQALLRADHAAGTRLLQQIIDAAPSRDEARTMLARETGH